MKVTEFLKQLEKLGFNEQTKMSFGFLNRSEGEYYETEIVRVDADDRKVGDDVITVTLDRKEN